MVHLLQFAHVTIILLCIYRPAASVTVNPFIGTPIIVDYAPLYSTPAVSPAERLALSNEVSDFDCVACITTFLMHRPVTPTIQTLSSAPLDTHVALSDME